jgi:hypothetical protein
MNKKQYALTAVLVIVSAFTGAMVSRGNVTASAEQAQPAAAVAPAQAQKWQYVLVCDGSGAVDKQLRDLGATDWEVVGLAASEVRGEKQKACVALRRPKQ